MVWCFCAPRSVKRREKARIKWKKVHLFNVEDKSIAIHRPVSRGVVEKLWPIIIVNQSSVYQRKKGLLRMDGLAWNVFPCTWKMIWSRHKFAYQLLIYYRPKKPFKRKMLLAGLAGWLASIGRHQFRSVLFCWLIICKFQFDYIRMLSEARIQKKKIAIDDSFSFRIILLFVHPDPGQLITGH